MKKTRKASGDDGWKKAFPLIFDLIMPSAIWLSYTFAEIYNYETSNTNEWTSQDASSHDYYKATTVSVRACVCAGVKP